MSEKKEWYDYLEWSEGVKDVEFDEDDEDDDDDDYDYDYDYEEDDDDDAAE